MAAELEDPTVGGQSKIDTIKRGIGYDDLPKEKKSFGKFKKLLFRRAREAGLIEKDKIT